MDLRGKKFVLIGGAGLIGSHTLERLLKEDVGEVLIYDNFVRGSRTNIAQALLDPRVRIFEAGGDIAYTDLLKAALKGADGVFHFAALWLLQCHEYPRASFDVNVRGSFNVMEACVETGVKRLVFSSSASVYGDAAGPVMTEDHPYNNTTFYGASKIAGEHMLRSYHHRYGLPYVGLRYFNVFGPRQDYRGAYIAVIMKMLDALDKGQPPKIYGDGSQSYDFIYVGDCAEANLCAMKADTADRFYNVCSGRKTSIKELAQIILRLTESKLEPVYEPAGQTFVKNRIGSPARAGEELDFRAAVGLEEGLSRLIEWRRSHMAEVESRRAEVCS